MEPEFKLQQSGSSPKSIHFCHYCGPNGGSILATFSNILLLASPVMLTILIFGAKADTSYSILHSPMLREREMADD